MSVALPPIFRESRRLPVHTEVMVRRFARDHQYTVGSGLRSQAMGLMRRVHRTCFDKAHHARHVQALVWQVDDYKLTLQLAMEVGAFLHGAKSQARFADFEAAVNLAASIGKPCGSWQLNAVTRSSQEKQRHHAALSNIPGNSCGFTANTKPFWPPRPADCATALGGAS